MSCNGKPVDQQAGEGRDGQGRFVVGNPGGPGNPYGRRVGELKRAMLAAVSEGDIAEIIQAMVAKAKEGNVQAAKVVLSYTLGKPGAGTDPDRADVEEWQLQEETAGMMKGMAEVVQAPPAEVPLRTARVLRPLMGSILQEQMADMLLRPGEYFPEWEGEVGRPAPSAAEEEGPSANGVFQEESAVLREGGEELWEKLKECGAVAGT